MSDVANVNASESSESSDPIVMPLDLKNPIVRAAVALQKILDDTANSAASAADAKYAAQIDALLPLRDVSPHVAEAILKIERDRDADRRNARDAAAQAIRTQHRELFAALDMYGRPPVAIISKPGKSAAPKSTDTPLADANGATYVKRAESTVTNGQRTYVRTNAAPCGACPISETIAKTFTAAGNLRQDAYRAIGRSTTEQMTGDAHADCFAAYRDAESDFDKTVTVTYFDRVA